MGSEVEMGSSQSLPVLSPKSDIAQPCSNGWLPIESAPKDGTTIDVWRQEGGRDTVYWGFPPHDCGEMGKYCDSEWHRIRAPGWVCSTFGEFLGRKHNPFTHWRPLPNPPESSAADGASSRHEGGLRDGPSSSEEPTP